MCSMRQSSRYFLRLLRSDRHSCFWLRLCRALTLCGGESFRAFSIAALPGKAVGFAIAVFGLVSWSCDGPQSALDPAGHGAQWIADIFWWMTGSATVIWFGVIVLAIWAARSAPEKQNRRRTNLMIIGGGAVVPTLALALLLLYGLAPIPSLLAPAPPGSLQIEVSGEQWWWRVHYRPPGGAVVSLANEIRLPVGAPVEFHLQSPDVVHSFWIPPLGGKIDMIARPYHAPCSDAETDRNFSRRLCRVLRYLPRADGVPRRGDGTGGLRPLAGGTSPAGAGARDAARCARVGGVFRERLRRLPQHPRHIRQRRHRP